KKQICLGLFLDTEKAFDKVWHQGLLYKLKDHLLDTYYRLIQSHLTGRKYTVVYERAVSQERNINAGVPQGSVLGPLLYHIYTSGLPNSDNLTIAQFADDIAILSRGNTNHQATLNLQNYIQKLVQWNKNWRTSMNPNKSTLITFTYLRNGISGPILLNGQPVPLNTEVKYLGIILDSRPTWRQHITNILQRLRHRLQLLKFLINANSSLPLNSKNLIYIMLLKPIWQYSCSIWGSASNTQINRLQTFQNRVLRLITGAPWYVRNETLHSDLGIQTVNSILQTTYQQLHSTFNHHPNILIRQIPQNMPPARSDSRLKRKRHTDLLA
ncbi:putative RNA-directed DNA polymerase from transposon X-element, partial [Blattella germanica]